MRALICAPRMPEFDREGGSRRIAHLIEFLREAGWSVSFVARDGSDGERYAYYLQQLGVATYSGPETKFADAEYLPDLAPLARAARFDLAILVFWYIGEQYLPVLRRWSPSTRVIVDSVDLHFLRMARSKLRVDDPETPPGLLDPRYAEEMMRELNVYASSDVVFTVSSKEADLVNDFAGNPALAHGLPLMEDTPLADVPLSERRGIVFIGNFRHPPNVEAVDYLCHEVLRHLPASVLERHPIYIVGNALDDRVRSITKGVEHVHLVGWVPSVLPYLNQARISVVPLLTGAGTKTKLIQALSSGTPTVTTTIGAEGLGVEHERDALIADQPGEFAHAMLRLLTEDDVWCRIREAGHRKICAVHGRDAVRKRFWDLVNLTLERRPKANPRVLEG